MPAGPLSRCRLVRGYVNGWYVIRRLAIVLYMDVSDPTRSVTSALDGPILAVLASAGHPLTVGQVTGLAVRGSEIGIRRAMARLVEQGIVRATMMGRNQVHQLNRDHIAAEIACLLAGLRNELWRRLREEFSGWRPMPLYAAVFGSAARGDGDDTSDIDLLLVHPPFPDEKRPARMSANLRAELADSLGEALSVSDDGDAQQRWDAQVDRLRDRVELWTGNRLQVVDMGFFEWRRATGDRQRLLEDVQRDGIELHTTRAIPRWSSEATGRG